MIDKWITQIKKGFTLIELIIVIAILGILVLLAAPNFLGKTQDAEHVKIMADSKNIEDASVLYHLENEDWPRLTDDPYTADELNLFASDFSDKTGKEITLDPNGSYYNIDYDELSQYIKAPDNKKDYILQNPVGKVFHMENLTEAGENRVDYDTEIDESEDPVEEIVYEFTTAGKTGPLGPSQADLDEAYKEGSLEGVVLSNNGIQSWKVEQSGHYRIESYGAQGGGISIGRGGYGAIMKGTQVLEKGQTIRIIVGSEGGDGANSLSSSGHGAGGGGGGSFVSIGSNLLLAAGGGGGSGATTSGPIGTNASINTSGLDGVSYGELDRTPGIGGRDGHGGEAGQPNHTGGGGGGWFSDGKSASRGDARYDGVGGKRAFQNVPNGGLGVLAQDGLNFGGFGGGASGASSHGGGGGGGGYSGGGGGDYPVAGGGGGSYNSGENQENSVGNAGPGKVIITYLGK